MNRFAEIETCVEVRILIRLSFNYAGKQIWALKLLMWCNPRVVRCRFQYVNRN